MNKVFICSMLALEIEFGVESYQPVKFVKPSMKREMRIKNIGMKVIETFSEAEILILSSSIDFDVSICLPSTRIKRNSDEHLIAN